MELSRKVIANEPATKSFEDRERKYSEILSMIKEWEKKRRIGKRTENGFALGHLLHTGYYVSIESIDGPCTIHIYPEMPTFHINLVQILLNSIPKHAIA